MYFHRPGKVQKSKRQYAYVTPRNVGQLFLQIFIEFGLLVTPMSDTDKTDRSLIKAHFLVLVFMRREYKYVKFSLTQVM